MNWLVIDFLGTDAYEYRATRHSALELRRDINSTIYRVKLIKRAGVERKETLILDPVCFRQAFLTWP